MELKSSGIRDDEIGILSRNDEGQIVGKAAPGNTGSAEGAAAGAAAGVATGAGIGALWGLGILAGVLPGIGPAIAGKASLRDEFSVQSRKKLMALGTAIGFANINPRHCHSCG
jgi:hypothetical protein